MQLKTMNFKLALIISFLLLSSSIIPVFATTTITPNNTPSPTLTLVQPSNDQTIFGTTISLSGSYHEFYSPTTPNIYVEFDGGSNQEVSWNNGDWSYSGSLSSGWHNATVCITDQSGTACQEVQFLLINGQITPTRYNLILVEYSETCIKLLSHNIKSNCPPLKELRKYDTSNQNVAGRFVNINGTLVRKPAELNQWWTFVNKTGNPMVCVDCSFDLANPELAQLVMLEPGNFTFVQQNETAQARYVNFTEGNNTIQVLEGSQTVTRSLLSNRGISPDCLSANISYTPVLMADTISYLDSGCKTTHLQLNSTINTIPIPFDMKDSRQLKYESWLSSVKVFINNCINKKCQTPRDPNDNPGYFKG